MTLSRRTFMCVCGSGALLSACGGGNDGAGSGPTPDVARGCLFASSNSTSGYPGCGLPINSSGNAAADNAFRQEFQQQFSFWGLPSVSFSFLNDCDAPNAYANPDTRMILFGTSMAARTYAMFGSAIPLWQILAHEFGHQVQFSLGASWLNAATVAPQELEADMFSGFYLLLTKSSVSSAELVTAVTNAFSIGDFAYNDRNHHGTPNQRGAAVVAGAKVANEYYGGYIPRTMSSVRQRFAQELVPILQS